MSKQYDLNVYITHFVPPKSTFISLLKSFIKPRLSLAYLRSWARLLKHGTRGNQPWKKDIMTRSRKHDQINRMVYLSRLIESLSNLNVKSLTINIFTNSNEAAKSISEAGFKASIKYHVFPKYNKMNQFHNSPWIENDSESPWNLVWEHKSLLEKDYKKGNSKSLYLYIENDILFTQQNLQYWIDEIKVTSKYSLMPSFLRVEFDVKNEKWVAIDVFNNTKLNVKSLPRLKIRNKLFVQLPNSYSGLYLLNHSQLKIHIASKAFSKTASKDLTWWDLGARATSGNQFVGVPKGFSSRHVIKLDRKTLIPDESVIVHHMPNLYTKTLKLGANTPGLTDIFK
jgi:hypothetical protein